MRSLHLVASLCIVLAVALFAPQFSLGQYTISTIAGGGPNNLPAEKVSIGTAESVALYNGNLYIADSYSSQVFEVSVSSGTLTLVAGNGTQGYSGDGGPATSAALGAFGPQGIFVDGSGNIFISDTENSVIREVVASTGNIQTVAGVNYDASEGSACQSGGDGGPATSAYLCLPYAVFVDASGDIFIADWGNSTIREVVASTGKIQTVAGSTVLGPGYSGNGGLATSAQLDQPEGVFVDTSGNIFIADTFNSVIREVTSAKGFIQTVVGAQYPWDFVCNYSGDNGPPLSAQLCLPSNVFVDPTGDIFVADTGNSAIREVAVATGDIQTVAGTPPTPGFSGNGGLATSAALNSPNDMVIDSSGNIFIADSENFVVREVTASTGDIQAFAGNNFTAYSGDGGSPTNAELNDPGSVFVDASGNVYIVDTSNSAIRVYNPGASSVTIAGTTIPAGDIETVAGNGTACTATTLAGCGDGGLATSAELNFPGGVFVDAQGDIFIADTANSAIREVAAATGIIQTVAGNGTACTATTLAGCGDSGLATSAELSNPYGVFVDVAGNIFIADTDDNAIREVAVSSGIITTVAGNGKDCTPSTSSCGDGGAATSAQLSFPSGVFVDLSEDIFIADTSDNRIREVTNSNGIINTVAGTGAEGFAGDGAAATSAELDSPFGVWVDTSGDIFIADSDNAAIREVVAATGFIQTVAGIPATTGGFPTPGFSGDGGPATSAELNAPSGVFGTSAGKLFIADTNNSRIRELAPAALSVTVMPSTATVVVNELQQYTATVTGNSNTSVNWFVNGVAGGNPTVGTISTTGLFQAPATVPSPATVTIAAVSQVDNTTSGSAQATIANPSQTVTVSVSTNPPVTQVYTGTVQPFIATVTGASNTAVNWYVEGSLGGDATFGTIDTSGNYTAPANVPSPATVVIEAVSQADSTGVGTEQVTIVTAPSGPQGASQTVSPGGTANYSLSLNANTGSSAQPITLACLQGSLPAGATCAFSPTTITPSKTSSVPFKLAVSVPASAASLKKPGRFWHDSPMYAAFIPLAGFLLLGGRPRNQQRRWGWLVLVCVFLVALVACGGSGGGSTSTNPVTYTIKVQGTTAAQPNPVTITAAALTVQ
jgi:trimeric autotransporter adhesin